MSGPLAATSSGAAKAREEALMVLDDPGDRRRFRRRVPLIDLERAAKDDPVGPGEHVARPASEGILHFRLGLEDCQLTAGGTQVLVVEQVAAAEARAVEDQAFGQRRD